MWRLLLALLVAGLLLLAAPAAALAHTAPPCNDSDGDGSPSGVEYAQHHIVSLATSGGMGEGGHKPGSHKGFSLCLGVH